MMKKTKVRNYSNKIGSNIGDWEIIGIAPDTLFNSSNGQIVRNKNLTVRCIHCNKVMVRSASNLFNAKHPRHVSCIPNIPNIRKKHIGEYILYRAMIRKCKKLNIPLEYNWVNSFEEFINDMGQKNLNDSLVRIEPNKGYVKGNVKWVNRHQNRKGTRMPRIIDEFTILANISRERKRQLRLQKINKCMSKDCNNQIYKSGYCKEHYYLFRIIKSYLVPDNSNKGCYIHIKSRHRLDVIKIQFPEAFSVNKLTKIKDNLYYNEDIDVVYKISKIINLYKIGLRTKKYDIIFNNDSSSNNKGYKETYEYCKRWIDNNKNDSYFPPYKGGTVSIVNVDTGKTVYEEKIN